MNAAMTTCKDAVAPNNMNRPVRETGASDTTPAVKFCGITCVEDAQAADTLAPDYVGLVFWPRSKRAVDAAAARAIRATLDANITTVGVFVDEAANVIAGLAEEDIIQVAQLHGNECEAFIAELRSLAPDLEIWKAFEIESAADVTAANASSADMVLLDGGKGEGRVFPWELLAHMERPYALAGGLSPCNVAEALRVCSPAIVDVSSGIEAPARAPRKDPAAMAAFIDAVRGRTNIARPTDQQPTTSPFTGDRTLKNPQPRTPEGGTDVTNKTDTLATGSATSTASAIPAAPAPHETGRFGIHGGQYVPETLMNAVHELEEAYFHYKDDPEFKAELATLLNDYAGRPSRLYFAERLTNELGGAKIYLKREDLNHTGAHKINNVLGQALLAKKMGKTRLIAETGAGQHGVATATAAALLDLECEVFMGREDTERQALNVYKMRLLGATVHPVDSGTATLKDAVSETLREWTNRVDDTHYCLGSTMGPHPFPIIVRDFQSVISAEIKEQMHEREGRLPDVVMACVGGGSNAMGTFYNFIDDADVRLIGCEAAGRGIDTFETAATISTGSLGIFHGMKSYFCQDEYGQIAPVYSISAGLDYPGIGPEHAMLHDTGRAEYVPVTDDEAVEAFERLSRLEGIIPAIESSHALAHAMKIAPGMSPDQTIVVTLSGRGDKDCAAIARYRGEDIHE